MSSPSLEGSLQSPYEPQPVFSYSDQSNLRASLGESQNPISPLSKFKEHGYVGIGNPPLRLITALTSF